MFNLLSKFCYLLEDICRNLTFYFMFKGNKFNLKSRGML